MGKLTMLWATLALALPVAAQAQPPAPSAPPAGLEVRFCPSSVARSYPLDTAHGAQSLLLQNLAIINRSNQPLPLQSVEIALSRGAEVQDIRRFAGQSLEAVARGNGALASSGALQAFAFQFCDGALLGDARLTSDTVLEPGEALLVAHQTFAWRGSRDRVTVTVDGGTGGGVVDASAAIPIDGSTSRTVFRWPLAGGPWLVGAGSSFHTTHRWAVPEEFAFDIFAVGADGRSHRGSGERHSDFLAYGAPVLAAADSTVVEVVSDVSEDPPLLRRQGESMEAYMGRIGAAQSARLAQGMRAVMGDVVILDHGNGEYSVYAHLQPNSPSVRVGERVRVGQPIGRLGSSGNSTEPHLHFQVCDRPSAASCAGIPPTFEGIELPQADGPRPLQSGDVVIAVGAAAAR